MKIELMRKTSFDADAEKQQHIEVFKQMLKDAGRDLDKLNVFEMNIFNLIINTEVK